MYLVTRSLHPLPELHLTLRRVAVQRQRGGIERPHCRLHAVEQFALRRGEGAFHGHGEHGAVLQRHAEFVQAVFVAGYGQGGEPRAYEKEGALHRIVLQLDVRRFGGDGGPTVVVVGSDGGDVAARAVVYVVHHQHGVVVLHLQLVGQALDGFYEGVVRVFVAAFQQDVGIAEGVHHVCEAVHARHGGANPDGYVGVVLLPAVVEAEHVFGAGACGPVGGVHGLPAAIALHHDAAIAVCRLLAAVGGHVDGEVQHVARHELQLQRAVEAVQHVGVFFGREGFAVGRAVGLDGGGCHSDEVLVRVRVGMFGVHEREHVLELAFAGLVQGGVGVAGVVQAEGAAVIGEGDVGAPGEVGVVGDEVVHLAGLGVEDPARVGAAHGGAAAPVVTEGAVFAVLAPSLVGHAEGGLLPLAVHLLVAGGVVPSAHEAFYGVRRLALRHAAVEPAEAAIGEGAVAGAGGTVGEAELIGGEAEDGGGEAAHADGGLVLVHRPGRGGEVAEAVGEVGVHAAGGAVGTDFDGEVVSLGVGVFHPNAVLQAVAGGLAPLAGDVSGDGGEHCFLVGEGDVCGVVIVAASCREHCREAEGAEQEAGLYGFLHLCCSFLLFK